MPQLPTAEGSWAEVDAAARILDGGGAVVYPTETVYGLGVDALSESALQHLVTLKGREPGKPISVLVSEPAMLATLVTRVPPLAQKLMQRFWPGPLTLVLPARTSLSPVLTGGSGGIGVRISSHPVATALVRALGRPVTSPSANPAGAAPPVDIDGARAYFGDRVECYLDFGCLAGEPASTVADVRDGLRIVRQGAVPAAALQQEAED